MNIAIGRPFTVTVEGLPEDAVNLVMMWIPAGVFTMGSPEDEPGRPAPDITDEHQFECHISQGFWLGRYPVTQAQWTAVMQTNPSYFARETQTNPISYNRADSPVENVNWHEALSFCEKLNDRFGQALPERYRFSLPTEAQWEYACRAGTQTIYYSGTTEEDLSRVAWYGGNSPDFRTHPVGEKEPNAWGLHDMLGSVAEWCYDSPSDYPHAPATDWMGQGSPVVYRVIRGLGRCAQRSWGSPDTGGPWSGFRLCLRVAHTAT